MLTNVELDHHSTYASELEVRAAFDEFLASVRPAGTVVAWEGAGVAAGVQLRPLAAGRAARARRAVRRHGNAVHARGRRRRPRRGHLAGSRGAQRAERARGDRRRARRRPRPRARRARARVLPARRPPLRAKGRCRRRARVRRLRAPRHRGRGHAGGGTRARAAAPGGRVPAAPVLAHRPHARRPRPRACRRGRGRGAGRLPAPASGRRTTPAWAASWSRARRPTMQAGGRSGGCPTHEEAVAVLAPRLADG